jgi:hypothetical protein
LLLEHLNYSKSMYPVISMLSPISQILGLP